LIGSFKILLDHTFGHIFGGRYTRVNNISGYLFKNLSVFFIAKFGTCLFFFLQINYNV